MGRFTDGTILERADTKLADFVEVQTPFSDGSVALFESMDDEDRGGVVLRLRMNGHSGGYVPYAVNTDHGVDLHLGGDCEAEELIGAIVRALSWKPRDSPVSCGSLKLRVSRDTEGQNCPRIVPGQTDRT